jgi:hypothetical protein
MTPTRKKKTTKRKPPARAAKPAARSAKASRAAKPALRVVRAPRAAPPARSGSASFPQRAGASPKQLVMFELIRARAALLAAIHGLSAGSANEPMGDGRWSVRETVLHLITRDQARLRESESTRHGQVASWKGVQEPAMGMLNAELMAPLRHLDWEDALRTLHRVREQLMEEIESVPDEPAEIWGAEHPFGWMLNVLPPHDRHHADTIKRWRLERAL